MHKKVKDSFFYVIAFILFFLAIYAVGSKICYGEVYFLYGNNNKSTFKIEDLKEVSKDFQIQEDGSFLSVSPDPWFDIKETFSVKTILININKISEIHDSQVFYYSDSLGLDEGRSYYFRLKEGANYIQIPKGEYNLFRLDLTDCADVNLKIDSIVLYGNRVVPSIFLFFIIGIWGISTWVIYKLWFKEFNLNLFKEKLGEYKYYQTLLFGFIVITVIGVYGYLIMSGNQYVYYDIGGGDEPEAYIPLYFYYIKKIAAGEIAPWTFNNGLGTSTLSVAGYIFNPFILIVYIVGVLFGVQTINNTLLLVQIINIFVCGLLCYKYLSNFKMSFFANSVASYIFAFNGFIILFCQHYIFMQFPLYTLIILLLIEKLIESNRINKFHFIFSLVCMLIFCCSLYMGYMIGLFSGIYFIFRIFMIHNKNEIKVAIKKIFMSFGFAILGIMLAAPIVIPMAGDLLFNSNRITGDNTGIIDKITNFLFTPYPLEAMKTIFLRMLSNNFQGAGNDFFGTTGNSITDYYAPPTLFFSVFFLVFVFVYFMTLNERRKNKKEIVIQGAIGLLVVFLLFNRLGSAIFNALVDIFGRYSFILMPLFAVLVSVAIDQMLKPRSKNKYVVISALCTIIILLRQLFIALTRVEIKYLSSFIILNIILLVILVILFLVSWDKKSRIVKTGLVLLIFINVLAESFVTVNKRAFCSFSADLINENDIYTQDALEHVKNYDKSMYRIEKNYYDLIYYHDAYFQNYRGISTYNATLNKNIKEFYREYCSPGINFYGFDSFWYSFMNVSNDIIQNSLLGIRYIVSDGLEYPENMYEKIYQNNGTLVYKNKASNSFGIFYDYVISKSELEGKDLISKSSILQKAIVVEDNFLNVSDDRLHYEDIIMQLNEKECFNMQETLNIATDELTTYNLNGNQIGISSAQNPEIEIFFDKEVTNANENSFLEFYVNIGYSDNLRIYFDYGKGYDCVKEYYMRGSAYGEWQGGKILLPVGTKSIKINASCPDFTIRDLKIVSSDQPIVPNDINIDIDLIKDNKIIGSLNNNRNGYLFLPIPYEKGWNAFLDGEKVEIIQADSGFCAIELESGEHVFELEYEYPYFNVGVIVSLLGTCMLLVLFVNYKRAKNI